MIGIRASSREGTALDLGGFGVISLVVAVGGAALLLFVSGEQSSTLYVSDLLPVALGVVAAGTCLFVARHLGDQALARAWMWFACAMLLRTFGDSAWAWLELVRHERPFPSIADAGYVAFFPVVVLAFWSVPAKRRTRGELLRLGLDAGTVMLAGIVAVWYFVLGPTLQAEHQLSLAAVLNVVYPVCDMLLVLALGTTLVRRSNGVSAAPMQWMVASIASFLFGDLIFSHQSLHGTYQGAGWPDAFWTLGIGSYLVAAVVQRRVKPSTLENRTLRRVRPVPLAPYLGAVLSSALLLTVVRHEAFYPTLGVASGATAVTLLVVARQLAALSDNAKLAQAYETLATTDPLTGLATRGHLLDVISAAMDTTVPVGILMIDIDHFKEINDHHGHQVGDAALRHVADVCRANVRDADAISGRYGGDELVVSMFGVSAEQATAIAERIAASVRNEPLWDGNRDIPLTVSIGVAQRQPGFSGLTQVFQRADAALYLAKSNGRDRVEVAPNSAAAVTV